LSHLAPKPLIVSAAFILLVSACSDLRATTPTVALRDSARISIVENTLDESTPICDVSPQPTLTLGVTDGPPEYQFFRTFGARRLSDGRIVVVNQGTQELRFYSPEGRFLKAAGRSGEGPGEFKDAFTMRILPGDTVWVGDYRPWEWEVFSPDGSWQRRVQPLPPYLNPDVEAVLNDGRSVAVVGNVFEAPVNRFAPQHVTVILHAPDGAVEDTLGVYESGTAGRFDDVPNFVVSPLFQSRASITAGGSRVLVGHTSRAELRIHEIGDTVALDRIVRWNAELRPVTDADVAAERERIAASFEGGDEEMRRRLVEPQIREDRPVAETFPAFSTVELGRDGRIWVRGYRHPSEAAEAMQNWLIFDAEGTIQCRLSAERFEQMPDFGSDYILVMRRDELGVERLFLHTLSAPRPAVAATSD
jgi:PAS domain-containing protein